MEYATKQIFQSKKQVKGPAETGTKVTSPINPRQVRNSLRHRPLSSYTRKRQWHVVCLRIKLPLLTEAQKLTDGAKMIRPEGWSHINFVACFLPTRWIIGRHYPSGNRSAVSPSGLPDAVAQHCAGRMGCCGHGAPHVRAVYQSTTRRLWGSNDTSTSWFAVPALVRLTGSWGA